MADESVLQTLLDGQKLMMKQIGNMSGEISQIKNSQEDLRRDSSYFKSEMKSILENNPRTNQIGVVQQVADNKKDLVEVKASAERSDEFIRDSKGKFREIFKKLGILNDDVSILKIDWKLLAGKFTLYGGFAGMVGLLIWKFFQYMQSLFNII